MFRNYTFTSRMSNGIRGLSKVLVVEKFLYIRLDGDDFSAGAVSKKIHTERKWVLEFFNHIETSGNYYIPSVGELDVLKLRFFLRGANALRSPSCDKGSSGVRKLRCTFIGVEPLL